MVKRLLTSAVGIILLTVVLFLDKWVLTAVVSVLSMCAAYELLYSTKIVRSKLLLALAILMAGLAPLWAHFGCSPAIGLGAVLLCVVLSFCAGMDKAERIRFDAICAVFFAAIIIPLFFSCIIMLYLPVNGLFYLLLVLIISWGCDTFAMLSGMIFGKTKLIAHISPKKTVQGSIGGVIGAVGLAAVFIAVSNHYFIDPDVQYLPVLLMAFFGSMLGQIGDLTMSFIKREHNLKDFGKIFPGHGGILDRFDSVLFVAPLVQVVIFIVQQFRG